VNFLIRFFAAYAIIAFVSCIAEWARANTYARMIMFHKNMKNTINELEKARAELRTLTNIDPLTGIYNKRYLNVSMQMFSGCADKKYIVSMFFDIDHFKKYNDYYGHINGDRVLVEVVKTIKDRVQSSDGILVRFGGEEIVCLVKTDDIKSVENISKTIR
jgi:GGDEF domain-containing protein